MQYVMGFGTFGEDLCFGIAGNYGLYLGSASEKYSKYEWDFDLLEFNFSEVIGKVIPIWLATTPPLGLRLTQLMTASIGRWRDALQRLPFRKSGIRIFNRHGYRPNERKERQQQLGFCRSNCAILRITDLRKSASQYPVHFGVSRRCLGGLDFGKLLRSFGKNRKHGLHPLLHYLHGLGNLHYHRALRGLLAYSMGGCYA